MSSLKSPASSTRSSLDQSHSTTSASATSRAEAREARRNRSALRDYYNLASSTSASSSITNVTTARTDITQVDENVSAAPLRHQNALLDPLDEDNFTASAYVDELLSKSALEDVLRVQVALAQETRGLDGERKGLVYDNYGRLIGARDVVQSIGQYLLPSGRDPLASEIATNGQESMDRVKSHVDALGPKVEALALQIPKPTADDGIKAQDLKSREQKETVKWVLAAPARMEELLRNRNIDEANRLRVAAEALLDEWHEVDGVQDIRSRLMTASQLIGHGS